MNIEYAAYLESRRRSQQAYVRHMLVQMRLSNLAKFIAAGGVAEDSPDYQHLVDEIGIDAVVTELGKLVEMEDTTKPNAVNI